MMASSAVALPVSGTMPLPYTAQSGIYRAPYQTYGLHKTATTILADQGDRVTVVTDTPYRTRHATALAVGGRTRGARPMHRTTMRMAHQDQSSYNTTSEQFHGGKSHLESAERPLQYPSQHFTQFALLHRDVAGSLIAANPANNYSTHYHGEFPVRDVDRPSKLHLPTYQNKMGMNEGSGIKGIMTSSNPAQGRYQYWSQYNRTHNKLGAMLGSGMPRERQVRTSYNPVTGAEQGAAWRPDNKSSSSNHTLYHSNNDRKCTQSSFLF